MRKVTNTKTRRWGTVLVLIGGLIAPIGTAGAQDRGREHPRSGSRFETPHAEGIRRTGEERDKGRRSREEARGRREDAAEGRRAAEWRTRHEHAIEQASAERARGEQSRREALVAASQRAQEEAFVREGARIRWERARAARRESWVIAIRGRHAAHVAAERLRLAWATANRQVWVEQRGQRWVPDARMFGDEHRWVVRSELRRHAQKKNYLLRLRVVAGEVNDLQIIGRVDGLVVAEERRHQDRMARFGPGPSYRNDALFMW